MHRSLARSLLLDAARLDHGGMGSPRRGPRALRIRPSQPVDEQLLGRLIDGGRGLPRLRLAAASTPPIPPARRSIARRGTRCSSAHPSLRIGVPLRQRRSIPAPTPFLSQADRYRAASFLARALPHLPAKQGSNWLLDHAALSTKPISIRRPER